MFCFNFCLRCIRFRWNDWWWNQLSTKWYSVLKQIDREDGNKVLQPKVWPAKIHYQLELINLNIEHTTLKGKHYSCVYTIKVGFYIYVCVFFLLLADTLTKMWLVLMLLLLFVVDDGVCFAKMFVFCSDNSIEI